MKILLFGKDGQVGKELQRTLAALGELVCCGRGDIDLADAAKIRAHIAAEAPDIIVNAAAYTAVDKAESETDAATLVNAHAVQAMAEAAAQRAAWLVHYSTDYVFDGAKSTPYLETDATAPLNAYGTSKAQGEQAIAASGCKHLILRSSWVYSAHSPNFPLAILKRAYGADNLKVVDDSFGAPTKASLIADITALMLYRIAHDAPFARTASGTYHLVASGSASWHEYARFLVATARAKGLPITVPDDRILPVSSAEYPTVARRPQNCRLDNRKLQDTFDLTLPDWRRDVATLVEELVNHRSL